MLSVITSKIRKEVSWAHCCLLYTYINDVLDAVHYSRTLVFADDIKCFQFIKSSSDQQLQQHDLQ